MFDKINLKKLSAILLKLVPYIIAIASAVSAITPNHTDDEVIAIIKQISNVLALNVGHNNNSNVIDAKDDDDETECQRSE